MTVREMTRADVEAVCRIERECFSMPWSAADFLEMIEADYAHYYVAQEAGQIVGCCGIRNLAGEGEITNVAVAPGARRQGIGRKMMEHLLQEASVHKIEACTLEVRISNIPAIRL